MNKEQNSEYHLRRLATILHDSNDAITIQSLQGDILAWNRGAEKMYGYSEQEALQMNISKIVPKDDERVALEYIFKIAKGDIIESYETKRVTKNGEPLEVWLTITCLKDDQGNIDSIATTERDITPIKRELDRLRGMLPICGHCKNIRDDKGYWHQIEEYISSHSEVIFSHSLCPNCLTKFYPEEAKSIQEAHNKKKARAKINPNPWDEK